jgi:hypothetical protein
MLPATIDRVRHASSATANERIRQRTLESIDRVAAGGPQAIERRVRELDQEWDVERCLEVMAPTFSLIGLGLGILHDKRWLTLPVVVQAFFLQHALQGWCPPLPILRELGVRTQGEIEEERYALKALRGDFRHVKGQGSTRQAFAATADS